MDKITEQQIEEQLKQLAALEPGDKSVKCATRKIRRDVLRIDPKWPVLKISLSMAAVLVIGIGLLLVIENHSEKTIEPPTIQTSDNPLSLSSLNSAFESGGMEAVDQIFKQVSKLKKPGEDIKTVDDAIEEDED